MAKPFTPTPHPVLGLPSPAQMAALGREKWAELMVQREERIVRERSEPFPHWYEPPIWKVCDALLGFPWVDAAWAERMRRHLGFDKPVKILMINGGNRGGKSEYASDRVMRVLRLLPSYQPDRHEPPNAWCLHSTLPMSRDYQQRLLYQFLPAELRARDIKSRETYIAYKQKTGFSEEKFVLPGGADCVFKVYEQDRKTVEGGNVDIIWNDELVPSDWVETMELRIAEKSGWMLITFTPVEGYSETVRLFQDGAEVVQSTTAFLLPRDGGEPDVARALGLNEAELEELKRAETEQRAALCPQSVPEDCDEWLNGGTGQPEVPAGREFEIVPRVLKCVSSNPEQPRACVFFHTADNPYGNPRSVWGTIAGKNTEFKRERFYGVANKILSVRFPKFNLKVHVVGDAEIPKDGTNYLVVDPAGRNFFMKWYRVTPKRVFLYREWPGNYHIPEVGFPGLWALPSGRHPDGRPGPAQKAFGWGYLRYKEEIARLEGWKDYKVRPDDMNTEEWNALVAEWDERNGSREDIQERFLDSRFASTPKMENDRPITMLEKFSDLNLHFTPTPGDDVEEGVQLIQDALDYDETQPVDFFNCPRFQLHAGCLNSIYALQTWTGYNRPQHADDTPRRNLGGATKDPVDCDRYFFLSDCTYLGGTTEPEKESEFTSAPAHYY